MANWCPHYFVLLVGGVLGYFLSRAAFARCPSKLGKPPAQTCTAGYEPGRARPHCQQVALKTDRVALVLNGMLDRINELVDFQKNTMDHIAHDVSFLRSTRLRAIAEHSLSDDDQEWAGKVIGECDYILGLVKTLLDISAAESRHPPIGEWRSGDSGRWQLKLPCGPVLKPLFDKKNIRLEKGFKRTECPIRMDEQVWQRVVR